jgi:hypothetical protein
MHVDWVLGFGSAWRARAITTDKGDASLYPLRLPRPITQITQIPAAVQHGQDVDPVFRQAVNEKSKGSASNIADDRIPC